MLIPAAGRPVGLIGGGCLESDLLERAAGVLRSGEARLAWYDTRSPDDIVWGTGAGCQGEVRVLLERLESPWPDYLRCLQQRVAARLPTVVVTVYQATGAAAPGQRLVAAPEGLHVRAIADVDLERILIDDAQAALRERRSRVVARGDASGTSCEALVEYVAPRLRLMVFGAGLDAIPLAGLGRQLGWEVTLLDHRPERLAALADELEGTLRTVTYGRLAEAGLEIDSRTAVVVMTHHFLHDLEILRSVLDTSAPYVGVLGPRRRRAQLLQQLGQSGLVIDSGNAARLAGPAGLDIGAETPQEVALAIAAEIHAVLESRPGGFLRDRRGPLHDWP